MCTHWYLDLCFCKCGKWQFVKHLIVLHDDWLCLNYIQLCKASRRPPSDIRIPAKWPLSSRGDGEPLWCHRLLQQPIWSKWETTVRNLWWTVTNQAVKSPCLYRWQQLFLLIVWCCNTVMRSFSDSSTLGQCANSVLTLTCQSRSYCMMWTGRWEGHSIGHAHPELKSHWTTSVTRTARPHHKN